MYENLGIYRGEKIDRMMSSATNSVPRNKGLGVIGTNSPPRDKVIDVPEVYSTDFAGFKTYFYTASQCSSFISCLSNNFIF